MSKVKNPNTLEGVIHQAFHLLAVKHKMDVDKVADIIRDYHDLVSKNLKRVYVRKVRSKSRFYGKIIEVTAPVRFYWHWNGEYDGFDFDFHPKGLSRHQDRLLDDVMEVMASGVSDKPDDDIPPVIKKEFGERV